MADIFSTRKMLQMISEGNLANHTWLRDRYFSNRQTFNTKMVEFDIVAKGDRKIAPFVNPRVTVSERQFTKLRKLLR